MPRILFAACVAAIERQRAELRKVPGREGILAEERLYSLFDEELIIRDFFQDRRDGYLVTDQSGIEETFYRSPLSPGLSSTHKELAGGKVFGADLEPEEVKISTLTLDDLLDREGVSRIEPFHALERCLRRTEARE